MTYSQDRCGGKEALVLGLPLAPCEKMQSPHSLEWQLSFVTMGTPPVQRLLHKKKESWKKNVNLDQLLPVHPNPYLARRCSGVIHTHVCKYTHTCLSHDHCKTEWLSLSQLSSCKLYWILRLLRPHPWISCSNWTSWFICHVSLKPQATPNELLLFLV